MLSWLREPESQAEIDRNLFVICWLMILPSVVLLFKFSMPILILLLIGGLSRLWIAALRLPSVERRYIRFIPGSYLILFGLWRWLGERGIWFPIGLVMLLMFWAAIVWSDRRFIQHSEAFSRKSPEVDKGLT